MAFAFFVKQKYHLVLIGFMVGVIFTVIVTVIQLFAMKDRKLFNQQLPEISYIQQQSRLYTQNTANISYELLKGLEHGLSPIVKDTELLSTTPKQVRMLYIVGHEGSGHHLWENIMIEMSKHSDLITADYIYNEVLLAKLLHSCFIEVYHQKKNEKQMKQSKEWQYYQNAIKNALNQNNTSESGQYQMRRTLYKLNNKKNNRVFVEYACNSFEIELKKVFDKLPNKTLLYMRSFSYPYFAIQWHQIPVLPKLINIAQRIGFDIKLIVMKREFVNSIVSSCVHRFGNCQPRIIFTHFVLSIIQAQLFTIDTKYWIMIDYEDFIKRPLEYTDITSEWLKIADRHLIETSFRNIVKPSNTSFKSSGWKEITNSFPAHVQLLRNLYYSQYSKHLWPIYDSTYFMVTPENTAFLNA